MIYLRFLSLCLIILVAPTLASASELTLCNSGYSYFSGQQSLCQKTLKKELSNGLWKKVDLVWACHKRDVLSSPNGCVAGSSQLPGDLLIREGEIFFNGDDNKVGSNGAHLPNGPYQCCFTQIPPPHDLFRSVSIEPIIID